MKKRKWQDTNDLDDLGLSRSTLRSLDVMEGIRDDLDRIQNDLDSVQSAREGLNSVKAALNDTNIIGRAEADTPDVRLENFRGAYASVRLAHARIPSAVRNLEGRMADARFTKPPIPSTSIFQGFGTASRIHGLLGALPEAARRPSPVTPLVSSIIKASDTSKGLVNLEPPRLFSKMAGIERSWSGMTISPGSDLGKAGFGLIDKDLRVSSLKASSILNDLQGSSVLKYLQSFSALTETRSSLFPKALTEIFGANNTLANLSVATPNRMFDLIRGMETDLNNVWQRMMPTFDSIGRHWSRMLEALPRIDWEAVERAARVREARRPRTRIGFAALNAYDEL